MIHSIENLTLWKPPPSKKNRNDLKKGQWIYSDEYFYNASDKEHGYKIKWLIDYVDSEIICIKIGKGYCAVPLSHYQYKYFNFQVVDENFQPIKKLTA